MGWTIAAVIAVNLAALAVSWLLLRGWLARRLSVPRQAADLGDEVGRLVIELDQAAERNVVLLEDRIAALNGLLDAADKKIGLLRREIERHEAGDRVYGQLAGPRARAAAARAAEAAPAVPVAERDRAGGADARTAMRDEVGRLARTGLAAAAIAARVGAPLGEVELILSLEQRARGS